MALINTLRNKMGKFIVAAVAIAIMSFVMADLFGPNSTIMGGGNDVGEIAGKTITLKEFQSTVQERESSYALNTNRQPTENERPTIRQQAWDLLITKYAFQKQYDKVGVQVTDDEVWDMLQGKNINPGLEQAFTNPQTGQYDRDQFMNYLQQLPSLAPEAQVRWELFKKDLVPGRTRLKYENLLAKSNYVTTAEAKREYNSQNDVAEIKYLYVPYYAVSDSAVSIDNSTIKTYYNNNKEKYKVEHTKSLKYVSFEVVPSVDDSTFVREELQSLKEEFGKIKDDSVFASLNTDGTSYYGKYNPGNLPAQLKANIANLSKGDIRGPYLDSDGFKLYKITNIFQDTISYARASHILIKGDDDEAKAKAKDILNQIKNGADFAAMAREYGTDGTSTRGGDLGWFESGKMVSEFEDAVFSAKKVGLLNDVIKTQFGYHIIKVDDLKNNTAYKIASIERDVLPSDQTINSAFTKADLFAANVDGIKSFDEQAKADTVAVVPVAKLKANDRRVGVLGDGRQIVQWLFTDASTGDISRVFELDNAYVVAVMTGEVEKGYQSLDDVSVIAEISVKVKKEAKGKQIISKLNGLTGSLREIATAYGSDASIYSSSDLLLSATSLPTLGFDPVAVGTAFSLEAGETSKPFAGENGVLIMMMENKTIAPEIADYATYKNQILQKINGQVGYNITEAIKENADIVDERYKVY